MLFEACSHTFRCAAVKLFEHTCLVGEAFFLQLQGRLKYSEFRKGRLKKKWKKE
jgi:hypothetical protein